jgi:hypothetical protein
VAVREMELKKRISKNCITVDVKSKKILSMKVTDKNVHDGKMLPGLIEDITKSKNMAIDKILADGAYDSNDFFKYLSVLKNIYNLDLH